MNNCRIKKIKVKSSFYESLKEYVPPDTAVDMTSGILANFTGIPIIIDDTIDNDYEIEE